jgi:hypothetical protein
MSKKEYYENQKRYYEASGNLNYSLSVFGDHLAQREEYKAHAGMEAVYFYLVQKYHWKPSDVKGMSLDDIRFVLEEEMHGWVMPEDAR